MTILASLLSMIPDATRLALAIAQAVGELKGFLKAHVPGADPKRDQLINALARLVGEALPVARTLSVNHPLVDALREAQRVLDENDVHVVDINIPPRPASAA